MMLCPHCGEELEAGSIYCKSCGEELQIVPDYDPLEELVIGQEEETDQTGTHITEEHKENIKDEESSETEKTLARLWKSKLLGQLLLMFAAILVCFGIFLQSYRSMGRENDYDYQIQKGKDLIQEEQWEEALPYLKQAWSLQGNMEGGDVEALRLMARAYAAIDARELAVGCMKDAVFVESSVRGANYELEEIYFEFMEILNQTKQTDLIDEVIEECEYEDIRKALLPYRVEKPVCDMAEGTYNYYVMLELEAEYGAIYYTLDGTEPTKESTRYEKPIELAEGETLLSAVAINKKGMVSEPLVRVYRLEFKYDPNMDEED